VREVSVPINETGVKRIVLARIHPGIGIARIGNSESGYFIGPELPFLRRIRSDSYRDDKGRLKRQAAKFRIYGYDENNEVVGELTTRVAEIVWTVHVANKKAAWYDFDVALDLPEAINTKSSRRNSCIQGKNREQLIIDPGAHSIAGQDQRQVLKDGNFLGQPVCLGELQTDAEGRLLFLGGRGVSRTPLPGNNVTTFANNAGWYDDTSDGPVSASVKLRGKSIPVDPAWVVVAPPNYAPEIITVQTMHDVMSDALAGIHIPKVQKPSFTRDILPLFEQFSAAQWVNRGFYVQFGWKGPNDFSNPEYLSKLAAPGDEYSELRRQVFYMFRSPAATTQQPLLWPQIYGDAFGNFDDSPRAGFAMTKTKYRFLGQWMKGDFVADFNPELESPHSLEDADPKEQPGLLDTAALRFCMGGPFHPGCEMTWPMRRASMYRSAFRLRQGPVQVNEPDYGEYITQTLLLSDDGPLSSSGPGDITKWMAIPWQTDTASCRSGYPTEIYPDPYMPTFWPARVPNHVITEDDYNIVIDESRPFEERLAAFNRRCHWLRALNLDDPYIDQITKMVKIFSELGIVERRVGVRNDPKWPEEIFVEVLPLVVDAKQVSRTGRVSQRPPQAEAPGSGFVSEEFFRARFGGLGRRQ
jgi:L-Lysine epsilon oxidase N-terminal/L-lysine epsilon oxidase C-terminal domain